MTNTKPERRNSRQCPIPGCTQREDQPDTLRAHLVLEHGMGGEPAREKAEGVF